MRACRIVLHPTVAGALLLVGVLTIPGCSVGSPPSQVAFVRDHNVWTMNMDGTMERALTTTGDCSSPSWSPDGTELVYLRGEQPETKTLWILDVVRGAHRRLTENPAQYECPRWSPNGKWIACFRTDEQPGEQETPNRILLVDPLSGETTLLNNEALLIGDSLAWSSDSTRLAYSYGLFGGASVSVVSIKDGCVVNRELYAIQEDTDSVAIDGLMWIEPGRILLTESVEANPSTMAIRLLSLSGEVQTIHRQSTHDSNGWQSWILALTESGGLVVSPNTRIVPFEPRALVLRDGRMTTLMTDAADACCYLTPSATRALPEVFQTGQPTLGERTAVSAEVRSCGCRCPEGEHHGDIRIRWSDGSNQMVTRSGMATMVDVAEDGTVAWIEGEHVTQEGARDFFGRKLVVYRGGKVVRTIEAAAERPGVVWSLWMFEGRGDQLLIAVGPLEKGPCWIELRDTVSGKPLKVCAANASPVPEWAMDLVGILGE